MQNVDIKEVPKNLLSVDCTVNNFTSLPGQIMLASSHEYGQVGAD